MGAPRMHAISTTRPIVERESVAQSSGVPTLNRVDVEAERRNDVVPPNFDRRRPLPPVNVYLFQRNVRHTDARRHQAEFAIAGRETARRKDAAEALLIGKRPIVQVGILVHPSDVRRYKVLDARLDYLGFFREQHRQDGFLERVRSLALISQGHVDQVDWRQGQPHVSSLVAGPLQLGRSFTRGISGGRVQRQICR
jgi:hypothetical protein